MLTTYCDRKTRELLARCTRCGRCIAVCPNRDLLELRPDTLTRLPATLLEVLGGAAASDETFQWIFGCDHCGRCRDVCPAGLDPFALNKLLRRELRRQSHPGVAMMQRAMTDPLRTIEMLHQLVRGPGPPRWYTEPPAEPVQADTVVFLGCAGLLRPDITAAVCTLLDAAGIDYVALGGTRWCCGSMFQFVGDMTRFARHLDRLLQGLRAFAPREVVYLCAECQYNAVTLGPQLQSIPFAQTSVSELLARHLPGLAFTHPLAARVTLHDACSLARLCGDPDSPRALLSAVPGIELVEMEHAGCDSLCCGAACEPFVPGKSARLRQQRRAEFERTGAGQMVTTCVGCETAFQQQWPDAPDRVVNLYPLLARALGSVYRDPLADFRSRRDVDGAMRACADAIDASDFSAREIRQTLARMLRATDTAPAD